MVKKIGIILFLVLAASTDLQGTAFAQQQTNEGTPCPPECVTDSMEIVTWYPSPYNEYEELRLYPISDSNSQCNSDNRGLMYYDSDDDKVKLCKGPAGLNNWQDLGGGAWEVSGNDIYNANSGNIGIGTINPKTTLDINGTMKLAKNSAQPFACDADHDGAIALTSVSTLCICQGSSSSWFALSDGATTCSWENSPSAIGGTITDIGGYRIHTFTSSGTLTTVVPGNVEVLVVAGGGGGGGGGVISHTSYFISGSVPVTVGAGGAGSVGMPNGTAGGNSIFGSIIALGGGYGNGGNSFAGGGPGGSGGGGSGSHGGSGTTSQGFAGGTGTWASLSYGGGGGGGASAVGANGTAIIGGAGGNGIMSSISGYPAYYGGGGGGGGRANGGGAGGLGGGGAGGNGPPNNNGVAGTANTGGGGGGMSPDPGSPGAGGSGIVIVRYRL